MMNNSEQHNKRFGQFFSGKNVAELLTWLLPENVRFNSVIDPMAGSGDLLKAVLPYTSKSSTIIGIEIDSSIAEQCQNHLPNANVICADAFKCENIITNDGWDLVITNPPYVRYQLQKNDSSVMPSGNAIRNNLLKTLSALPYLKEEQHLFTKIARNYSGLADMAVPAWIICASLVKKNGYLAMIVPDTWLNREYSKPIQYLLSKIFDVIVIAKDINAVWFKNALVRTCLVVARRSDPCTKKSDIGKRTAVLELGAELIGSDSLIDNLKVQNINGRKALQKLLLNKKDVSGKGFSLVYKTNADIFPNVFVSNKKIKWVLDEDLSKSLCMPKLPYELEDILNKFSRKNNHLQSFITLKNLDIYCGQGLRTGANDFFYFDVIDEDDTNFLVKGNKWYSNEIRLTVPKNLLIKCLKSRNQISGICVNAEKIMTAVLYLNDTISSHDMKLTANDKEYRTVPKDLDDYIQAAEKFHDHRGLSFKEYSAVKTNEKQKDGLYERMWYMLPSFAPRHIPDLCISRVCSADADCMYVEQADEQPIAVDANFVTLWGKSSDSVLITLALLNSTWSKCFLELSCTVMGGGALKIEANQISRILFPSLSKSQLKKLADLGGMIAKTNCILPKLRVNIDNIILEKLEKPGELLFEINSLLKAKLANRGVKYEF